MIDAREPTRAFSARLTDFDQARATFRHWQGQFTQVSRGKFDGEIRAVNGSVVRTISVTGNQRVVLRGKDASGLVAFYPVTPGTEASLWQGRQLPTGHLVVNGIDTEINHCTFRRFDAIGCALSLPSIQEAVRVLGATHDGAVPRAWAVLSLPPERSDRLLLRLRNLLAAGVGDPSIIGSSEGVRLEQDCVRALVGCLVSAGDQRTRIPLSTRSNLVARVEEFMRSRLGDPIGAIDLCREVGVADRTLRLAFLERYGLGPMAYLKCLRLNAVRSRLKASPPVAVAEAARGFGFHHLGNFAADYRRLFGELPSTTHLRNTLVDPARQPPSTQQLRRHSHWS